MDTVPTVGFNVEKVKVAGLTFSVWVSDVVFSAFCLLVAAVLFLLCVV